MILAYIRSDLYLFARKQLYAKKVITCLIKRTISIFKFGELVRMDVFALLQPDELSDDNQQRMGVEEEGNPIIAVLY